MKTKLKINCIIGIAALCTICNAQELTYTGNIIQARQFAQNQNITRIICPNVVQIEGNAFNGSAIKEIFLNKNQPVELSPRAFANAQHLDLVNLERTENIPDLCFDGCVNLRIFYADHVTHIGAYAFNNCRNLKMISLKHLVEADPNAFTNSEIQNLATYKIPNQFQQILPWTNRGVNLMERVNIINNRGANLRGRVHVIILKRPPCSIVNQNNSDSFESFIEESFEEDSE